MSKPVVLMGGDMRAAFWLLGYLKGSHVQRARGIHSGAIAVVLWACDIDTDVFTAALAACHLEAALFELLPDDAHKRCNNRIVIALCKRGWFSRGDIYKCGRWTSKSDVISTVVDAVTMHPAFNYTTGVCSALRSPDTYRVCANAQIVEVTSTPVSLNSKHRIRAEQAVIWCLEGNEAGLGNRV